MTIRTFEPAGAAMAFDLFRWEGVIADAGAEMLKPEHGFVLADEQPGFHEIRRDDTAIRARFCMVEAFEVEHLAEGFTTRSLMKRLRSCDVLLLAEGYMVATGDQPAVKLAASTVAGISDALRRIEPKLEQFRGRLAPCRGVEIVCAKGSSVRVAKLKGTLEDEDGDGYHGTLAAVTGGFDLMDVSATSRGVVRVKVRRAAVIEADQLVRLARVLEDRGGDRLREHVAADPFAQQAAREFGKKVKKTLGKDVAVSIWDEEGPPLHVTSKEGS